MGTVVQLKMIEQPGESSRRPEFIDPDFLTLAEEMQTFKTNKDALIRNIQIIESTMICTENPELRERLLGQLESIYHQLLLVSWSLVHRANNQRKNGE